MLNHCVVYLIPTRLYIIDTLFKISKYIFFLKKQEALNLFSMSPASIVYTKQKDHVTGHGQFQL